MKKAVGILFIVIMSLGKSSMASVNVVTGESPLHITYSRVLNILTQRNAQTKALEEALQKSVQICRSENFEILNEKYATRLSGTQPIVQVQVSFKCL